MPRRPLLSDYRAVLFDVDGTLVNSLEMIVLGLGDAIEKYAGTKLSEAELLDIIGLPLRTQMAMFAPRPELVPEMISYAIGRMDAHLERESLYEPAIECLRLSHERGLKTALVTSKSQEELIPFLERFIGAPSVDTAVCASDVSRPKPDPESALLACERLGVSPSESIFIGDSVFDIRCARNAGITCVAVAYGAGQPEALEREAPNLLLHSPEELLSWAQDAFLQTSCREKS
jgi:HAD superfamily hydrolase (TIGR01509 family)